MSNRIIVSQKALDNYLPMLLWCLYPEPDPQRPEVEATNKLFLYLTLVHLMRTTNPRLFYWAETTRWRWLGDMLLRRTTAHFVKREVLRMLNG